MPSHYLNQCWNIANWTLRSKLQWNLNRNPYSFIDENAFEYVVWKIVAILSWPQCVNVVQYIPRANGITCPCTYRADSRFAPSQWETLLQSNAVSHWLGANLKSALHLNYLGCEQTKCRPHQLSYIYFKHTFHIEYPKCILTRLSRHLTRSYSILKFNAMFPSKYEVKFKEF